MSSGDEILVPIKGISLSLMLAVEKSHTVIGPRCSPLYLQLRAQNFRQIDFFTAFSFSF